MKLFKTLKSYTLYTLLLAFLVSCSNTVEEKQVINENFNHQLYNLKGGWQYTTVEFEGHTYLCNSNGGIIHVESCKCKNGL